MKKYAQLSLAQRYEIQILRQQGKGQKEIAAYLWGEPPYFITLQYGKEMKTKQLVVRH